jgi:preprotein translocase subunit YajC
LVARNAASDETNVCMNLRPGDFVVSRAGFIATIVVCALTILISWAALAMYIIRDHRRRREAKVAVQRSRKAHYATRISMMQREIDASYGRQYSQCHQNPPENPFMCSDSPVELMLPERVWEVPANPARLAANVKRKSMARSLFYDNTVNLWLPKR